MVLVSPRLPAIAGALALLVVTAAPAPAAPAFVSGGSGFHSVLAYGQGQATSAVDLALNQANGTVPESFTSEAKIYNRVVTTQPNHPPTFRLRAERHMWCRQN